MLKYVSCPIPYSCRFVISRPTAAQQGQQGGEGGQKQVGVECGLERAQDEAGQPQGSH